MVFVLSMCCFILGSAQQYLLGMPDQVAASCGVDLASISVLMVTFALCNAIGTPVVVMIMGQRSNKRQLCVALILQAIGLGMMALTSNFTVLIIARCICGVGNGVFVAIAYVVAQDVAPEGKKATYMANVALGFSAATVLALPIARALRDVVDWHVAYGILAVFALFGLLYIARTFPEGASSSAGLSFKQRMAPLTDITVLLALVVTLLEMACYSTAYTYITPYVDAVMPGISSGSASIVMFIIGICSLVGTKACGRLGDFLGIKGVMLLGLILETSTLVICGLFPGLGVGIIVLLCIWTAAAWMYEPIQNLIITRLTGKNAGMALALANSFLQLGNALGSGVAGVGVSVASVLVLPFAASILIFAGLLCELVVFKRAGSVLD